MQFLGRLAGHCVTGIVWLWTTYSRYLQMAILILVAILAVPPVTQYWLSRVRFPEVPVTAIVAMAVAAVLLVVFAGSMYILTGFLQQLVVSQRVSGYTQPYQPQRRVPETGGTFLPADDGFLKDQEDLEILRKKGILHETDVEGLASEIGHAHILKTRGRTENN